MNGGSKFLASAAILALAACGGSQAKLEIRPIPAPVSATAKPVPVRIAEAHRHLALGNVALALESYRKALREQPESIEALVGLAHCYDRMARFDLSRRYYEEALAIVPADPGVLNALARSLDTQGRSEEATTVRGEIAVRVATAKQAGPAVQATVRPVALVQAPAPVAGPSVTVALPAPRPAAAAPAKLAVVHPKPPPVRQVAAVPAPAPKPVAIAPAAAPAVAARKSAGRQVIADAPASAPKPTAIASPLAPVVAARPRPVQPSIAASAPVAAPAPSVTVALGLPPKPVATPVVALALAPKPVATPVVAPAPPRAPAAAAPVTAAPSPAAPPPIVAPTKVVDRVAAPMPPVPAPVAIARQAPIEGQPGLQAATRLERLSPGEVVLVTTGKPQWRSKVVGRTAQSTTIRYVPLRTAQVRMVQIRLLNAARHQGLAARTRRLLANRGWRQLSIGDATRVRRTSLILYPPNRRATAERLAKQFGFPIAKRASGNEFVMLLGRDATRIAGARAGG
jgi:hypothetical protein